MDSVLRPGMRLLRQFSLPTKFSAIAVVLLIPLMISLTGGYTNATEQVTATRAELDGLAYVEPMTRLIVQIGRLHDQMLSGGDPRSISLSAIADVDVADRELGSQFGVQSEWRNLRDRLKRLKATQADTTLHPEGTGPTVVRSTSPQQWLDQAIEIRLALSAAIDLNQEVATASHLMLDPGVESHHLVAILVTHLPGLIESAALAHESAFRNLLPLSGAGSTGATGSAFDDEPSALARNVAEHELSVSASRISNAIRQAWSSTTDQRIRDLTQSRWQVLDGTARDLGRALSDQPNSSAGDTGTEAGAHDTAGTGRGGMDPRIEIVSGTALKLTSVALPFAMSLAQTVDLVLTDRIEDLKRQRLWPFALSVVAFVLSSYLFAALYRATSTDARAVLGEINSVAEGALHQNEPLDGRDEFALMSRAAVIARDRLTSLLGELRFQATHDDLTALGNRAMLREKLEEVIAHSPADRRIALVFMDLDGFADVNDSFGHDIGDQVLRTVGARLHHATRRQDVVVRIGGDDFAVLLPDAKDEEEVTEAVRRIQASLDEPIVIGGRRLRLRTNAGVAIGTAGLVTAAEMQRDADVAKYAARDSETAGFAVFEPRMHEQIAERAELSADFGQAIDGGQLEVVYQPIVDLPSGSVHGAEALVRWNHPTRGLIMPDVFVPLAETTGSMGALTRWVLTRSAHQLREWNDRFADGYPLTMDVNISATQLSDDRILGDLVDVLEQTGIDPSALILEITESALMRDLDTGLRRLRQIAAIGVQLALDDFGTGYSSLAHLRRMPVSLLKIDKSFVSASGEDGLHDHPDASMLRGIVGLGTSLGLRVVAEGVEHAGQERLLREIGCHLGQGYRYSSPLTAEEFTRVMETSRHTRRWPVSDPSRIPTPR